MSRRAQNFNKQFLYGTAAMGFVVLAVVFIFVSLSLDKLKSLTPEKPAEELYTLTLADGFAGDSAVVYVADSLLWSGAVPATDSTVIRFHRFSDDRSVIISRTVDDPAFFFTLPEKNFSLVFRKNSTGITLSIGE